jgi:hypothetical protein
MSIITLITTLKLREQRVTHYKDIIVDIIAFI